MTLGSVDLTVADLVRSIAYYTEDIGLRVLAQDTGTVRLGVPGRTLATLTELPGAPPAPESSAGLSHFAPEVTDAGTLARFVAHYASRHPRYQLVDHVVAHSCYVTDPDGHGIEITHVRPRDVWRWQNGAPVLVADPMPLDHFLSTPGADEPFRGLPDDTFLGHVQLKVHDDGLAATEAFYCDLLGFEVQARLGGRLLSVGVADYDAPLVFTNRFSTAGHAPAPHTSARLVATNLHLPSAEALQALTGRLIEAGHPHEATSSVLQLHDPSGNLLRFHTRT